MSARASGTRFLGLDPASAPSRATTDWLTAEIRAAIRDGRLPTGTVLPASRRLADDLGVSRGAVVQVYARLREEALTTTHGRGGTRVAATPAPRTPPPPGHLAWSRPAEGIELDLSPSARDLDDFPRAAWLSAERAVLSEVSAGDLGRIDPRGQPQLRAELSTWLRRTRGVLAEPDDILLVTGVIQALALLAQVQHAAGRDRVAVEDPGWQAAADEMSRWGLRTLPVAVDEDGLFVPDLPAVDTVLVTPSHQYPTGVMLAPRRRRDLLARAYRWDLLIIEDDYDSEYRLDRAPCRTLHASSPELVAYTGSTSKTLAPAIRVGWLVAPRKLQQPLLETMRASDLGGAGLGQLVLARLLASGAYDSHIRRQRLRLRARRDAMQAAIAQILPGARIGGVPAGLHLQVTMPDVDDREWARRAAEHGVWVQPLSVHRHTPGEGGLVLGYGAHENEDLREAVRRLADSVPG